MKKGFYRLLVLCFVASFLSAAGWLYTRQSLWRLADLQIESTSPALKHEAQKMLANYLGKNIMTISLLEIEKDLKQMPIVKSVSIWRRWPDTLKIKIIEKILVAQECSKNRCFDVDEDGWRIEEAQRKNKVPLLYGTSSTESRIVASKFLSRVAGERIQKVVFDRRSGFSMWLKSYPNLKIELGFDRLFESWKYFELTLKWLGPNVAAVQKIDLSLPNRAIVQRRQSLHSPKNRLNLNEMVRRTSQEMLAPKLQAR